METKITQNTVEIHPSVLAGLDVLSPEEKERVLNAIASLENFSPEQPMTPNIQKFRPADQPPFYLLHATPSYRAIFVVTNGIVEIIDLFLKERLEWFAQPTNKLSKI
jgi:mRNA-degrading endonuclease RelE of RelBE toxin-antitoxin system